MNTLADGTFADLRDGRRLTVAIPRCASCARTGFLTAAHTHRHNLDAAHAGERVYLGRVVGAPMGRAA